ncbi:MAG: TonB-dependent receptor [Terriglobia bacterium]
MISYSSVRGLFLRARFSGCRRSMLGQLALVAVLFMLPGSLLRGQGTNSALLRGTVTDTSGAVVPRATVTITDVATRISTVTATDADGRYIFNAVKPATYALKAEAPGFKTTVVPDLLLRVGAQTDEDMKLEVGTVTQTVEVKATTPLLNTVSPALGTTVSEKYIVDLPLLNRNIANLSYLSAGVTEVSGASAGQLGGTVIASNGQRYATAEFRVDGVLASRPEGGEGGTTDVDYMPSVEGLSEFSVQNNNMSAEYGNNGGTVVNIVTKSGGNQIHGSGWYFARRPSMDANDFFSNQGGAPKGKYAHDQYGGSVGGPIKKDKTFFFADFEGFRDSSPATIVTTVPTDLQRKGDFSQTFNSDGTLQQIFNPFQVTCTPLPSGGKNCLRQPFAGNVIPANMMDPIGAKLITLYPEPTGPGVGLNHINNYTQKFVNATPKYNVDVRIDENFSATNRLMGRYSQSHASNDIPDAFLEPSHSLFLSHDVALEDTWTLSPTALWTNRVGLNRDNYPQTVPVVVDPLSVGFPSSLILNSWYDEKHFPSIGVAGYHGLANSQCCTDTLEADTQWVFDSMVTKIHGGHNIKFGGEYRVFLNNFFQPSNTSGGFNFNRNSTMQSVFKPNFKQGNGLASMLTGFVGSGSIGLTPHVANESSVGSGFVQDDWKITSRLTINAGLRWEFSVPYTERYNRNQFSCFSCPSGISVAAVPGFTLGGPIYGTTEVANADHRHSNSDMNDFGPRLGLAYRLSSNTVIHAGGGVYYGLSLATNWQYGGSAFSGGSSMFPSLDGGITQNATMENPFPQGIALPQQGKYGPLTKWGFYNSNHASDAFQTDDIYQWNVGVQHQFGNTTIEADYVGNRGVHLPWGYSTQNRNFIGRAGREKYGTAGLHQLVTNPFLSMFQGPTAIFNEPTSLYNHATIPLIDILRPYPQFAGGFFGFSEFNASSSYNAFQLRFERRATHGLTFLGNYTFSKFIDNSDAGANAWIGTGGLGFTGVPQDFTNLAAEKSVSANDTPQRLTLAVVYELPLGRGQRFGGQMNKALDAVVGGWRATSFITLQSGQPIAVNDANGQLADGHQRPNVTGNPCSSSNVDQVVNGTATYFNLSAFSHPGDQVPGNAPRYFSNCRVPGIHNADISLVKAFQISETKRLEVRGDFINALNTPRFSNPDASFDDGSFGTISGLANSPRQGQIGVRFVF